MNSTELVSLVRRLTSVPDTSALGSTDAELLLHLDEALVSYLLPRLNNLRENFNVLRERVTAAARVRLPARAAFNKLNDIYFVVNNDRHRLIYIPSEELDSFPSQASGGVPAGYILEGTSIVLIPEGSYSGFLELAYTFTPGRLVLPAETRTIASIASNVVTLSSGNSSWTAETRFDISSPDSGSQPNVWHAPAVLSGVGNDTLTFTDPLDGTTFGTTPCAVGDVVTLSGESLSPNLPLELHPLLARAAALQIAESLGAANQVRIHGQVLEGWLREETKAMSTRIESRPHAIGRHGPLHRIVYPGWYPRSR